jgi:hypothetical protein
MVEAILATWRDVCERCGRGFAAGEPRWIEQHRYTVHTECAAYVARSSSTPTAAPQTHRRRTRGLGWLVPRCAIWVGPVSPGLLEVRLVGRNALTHAARQLFGARIERAHFPDGIGAEQKATYAASRQTSIAWTGRTSTFCAGANGGRPPKRSFGRSCES